MIETHSLTKYFGKTHAVDNLNLQINNELFCFLGPNGAGKTTTIKLMTGLLKPTHGTVLLDGIDIGKFPSQAKKSLGYVPDVPYLYERLTVSEFLEFIAELWKVELSDVKYRIEKYLDIFELEQNSHDLILNLSHGMRQKVSLIAALIHDPSNLLLDEPVTGLDPKSARILKDLLKNRIRKGTTVFLSTHLLEIAEILCDRAGIINKGKLIACGTMDELKEKSGAADKSLEDIFLELTGGSDHGDIISFHDRVD